MSTSLIHNCLAFFERQLLEEIEAHSTTKSYLAGQHVVEQGTYARFLPIVISGSVKVYTTEDTIQFLLYYISAGDPCIFSFAHIMDDQPIEFSAKAEVDSMLLLMPTAHVQRWMREYASFSNLLLQGYQRHYRDLLETTRQITCYNLEERLLNYLQRKADIEQTSLLPLSHQHIADDLGTSREVISRLMKKLCADGKAQQVGRKIKVLT